MYQKFDHKKTAIHLAILFNSILYFFAVTPYNFFLFNVKQLLYISVRNSLARIAICYSKLSWLQLKIEFG